MGDTQAGYVIYRPSGGTSRIFLYFSNGTTRVGGYISPAGTFMANTWYNVVVTMARNGTAQAYINGQLQAETLNISAQTGNISNYNNFTIGGLLSGKIDEVRLYNATIPTSQIEEQYYIGLNKMFAQGSISREEYLSRMSKSDYPMAAAQ